MINSEASLVEANSTEKCFKITIVGTEDLQSCQRAPQAWASEEAPERRRQESFVAELLNSSERSVCEWSVLALLKNNSQLNRLTLAAFYKLTCF